MSSSPSLLSLAAGTYWIMLESGTASSSDKRANCAVDDVYDAASLGSASTAKLSRGRLRKERKRKTREFLKVAEAGPSGANLAQGSQCDLTRDEFLDADMKISRLRQERDKLRIIALEARAQRDGACVQLKAVRHQFGVDPVHGLFLPDCATENLDEDERQLLYASALSSQDDVSSDEEVPPDCGIKISVVNLPHHWTSTDLEMFLAAHEVKASHTKFRAQGRGTSFVSSTLEMLDVERRLHLTLACGNVLRVRTADITGSIDGGSDSENSEDLQGEVEKTKHIVT